LRKHCQAPHRKNYAPVLTANGPFSFQPIIIATGVSQKSGFGAGLAGHAKTLAKAEANPVLVKNNSGNKN
jgi:hypothetical protein